MEINDWTTHKPILKEAVLQCGKDNILELGCGDGSSPMLREMGKELYSLESDWEWGKKYGAILVPDWVKAYKIFSQIKWGVVFVDNAPWEARELAIDYFKNQAEFVVLHDSDYFTVHLGIDFTKDFKFVETYYPPDPWPCETGPPTMLMSNFRDCHLNEIEEKYNYKCVVKE